MCVDFNMLEVENIPVIWECAIKVCGTVLVICDTFMSNPLALENHFFPNSSPNIHVEKLKRELFEFT